MAARANWNAEIEWQAATVVESKPAAEGGVRLFPFAMHAGSKPSMLRTVAGVQTMRRRQRMYTARLSSVSMRRLASSLSAESLASLISSTNCVCNGC